MSQDRTTSGALRFDFLLIFCLMIVSKHSITVRTQIDMRRGGACGSPRLIVLNPPLVWSDRFFVVCLEDLVLAFCCTPVC